MITIFVRGLPPSATEESVTELFSQYGTVRSLKLNKDLFTGKARGIFSLNRHTKKPQPPIISITQIEFKNANLPYTCFSKSNHRKRLAFVTTVNEDNAIAAPAIVRYQRQTAEESRYDGAAAGQPAGWNCMCIVNRE